VAVSKKKELDLNPDWGDIYRNINFAQLRLRGLTRKPRIFN